MCVVLCVESAIIYKSDFIKTEDLAICCVDITRSYAHSANFMKEGQEESDR